MQKLFLAETPHQFISTITTVHDITNTGENCMCRICKTSAESRDHSKGRCMHVQVQLCSKTKTNNYTKLVVLEVMHGWDAYQRIIYLLWKTPPVCSQVAQARYESPEQHYPTQPINYSYSKQIIRRCMEKYSLLTKLANCTLNIALKLTFSVFLFFFVF